MSWAAIHVSKLLEGETVQFRPHGNSMVPRIKSGALVTVEPATKLGVGDIVLCKVNGRCYLHLIKSIKMQALESIRGEKYLIGNNRGGINGWTSRKNIYGKCVRVED